MDPCSKCGRTLRDVARTASVEQRRGQQALCPVTTCPLLQQVRGLVPMVQGREAQGPSPPTLFVGRVGWPKVRLGPVLPPAPVLDSGLLDDPARWRHVPLEELVIMRGGLLRGVRSVGVGQARTPDRILSVTQELAMAARSVETEVHFTKDVKIPLSPVNLGHSAPAGPSVAIARAAFTENPTTLPIVERVASDTDATAAIGMHELAEGGIRVEQAARLLSAGLLGRGEHRTFVPTRWSVTAADDQVGKGILERVMDKPPLVSEVVHASTLHGNAFVVLLRPGPWAFEMVEAWEGVEGRWTVKRDAEERGAKRSYADEITGAYYAARLAVLERLDALQRQAAVLVLRIITPDYFAPAGVWVIREGVRMALEEPPAARDENADAWVRAWAVQHRSPLLNRTTMFTRTQASLDRF